MRRSVLRLARAMFGDSITYQKGRVKGKPTVSPYPFSSIDAYIDGECLGRIFKRHRECKSYVLVLRLVSEEGLSKMDEQAKKPYNVLYGPSYLLNLGIERALHACLNTGGSNDFGD
ncbi:MAG: hypothetical protein OEW62_04755 [Candidatus Bathyarchaeota archaeon]|nr:hypothetical protein [Candidatus Bathyarchaeota archaeon]